MRSTDEMVSKTGLELRKNIIGMQKEKQDHVVPQRRRPRGMKACEASRLSYWEKAGQRQSLSLSVYKKKQKLIDLSNAVMLEARAQLFAVLLSGIVVWLQRDWIRRIELSPPGTFDRQ
jgi:hypothetical protein